MGCLKEHLKKTNEELHSQAQATNVIDIQTKNRTTYGDAVQKTSYSCFHHQVLIILSVIDVIKVVSKCLAAVISNPYPMHPQYRIWSQK